MTLRSFAISVYLGITVLQSGCVSSKPKPATVTEQISAVATVTSLDPNTRELTLQTQKLGEVTVYAGPEVRNLAQVKVGDTVNVTYLQAVAVELSESKQARPGLTHDIVADQAAEGERPAATAGHTVSADVVIDSVDTNKNEVAFHTADGSRRVVTVQRAEGREFARKLKPGDVVTITFVEAIAAEIRPAAPRAAP